MTAFQGPVNHAATHPRRRWGAERTERVGGGAGGYREGMGEGRGGKEWCDIWSAVHSDLSNSLRKTFSQRTYGEPHCIDSADACSIWIVCFGPSCGTAG